MFCPKCGERNDAGAKFCAQCGCKLDQTSQADKKISIPTPKKQENQILNYIGDLSKKGKQVIGILSVILVLSIVLFYKNGTAYDTPKKALEKYQEYSAARKYGKLYELFDIKESKFVNKKTFVQACEEHNVSTEFMMAEDMKKSDHKRYFFFDQYQLDCMPSGVRDRDIYVPYIKGATLEVNGKKIGEDYLNKNQTEYVIRSFVPEDMTFVYKNTDGLINEKEYTVGNQTEGGSYWVNIEYSDKEKEKAKETLRKTLQTLKNYIVTSAGSYKDIEKYFATEKDAKAFWERGEHEIEGKKKLVKSPEITEGITINDAEKADSMRMVNAIPFDINCKYEYKVLYLTGFWANYEETNNVIFSNSTVLMRRIGNEWKLDVTSCYWGY